RSCRTHPTNVQRYLKRKPCELHPMDRTRPSVTCPIRRKTMLTYALIVFAITALGGLILAGHVLRDKFAPWFLSLLHALLGAVGLILLIVLLAQGAVSSQIAIGFGLLVLAALGGFFLASFHVRKKLPP